MEYPAKTLRDLLRAGRELVASASPENEDAFRALLETLITHERAQTAPAVAAEMAARGLTLRGEGGSRRLEADTALAASAQSADGDQLSITMNAEAVPEGLLLTVAITARQFQANWEGATVTVYRAEVVQDFATTNAEGECQLGPFSPGPARIEILAASGQRIVLPDIEMFI